ncbi:MAG: cyclic nucleotide-binding domain-containing protein [Acidimicrobiia bacterium]
MAGRGSPPKSSDSSSLLRVVLRDRRALRVTIAFTFFNGAEYAVWVALMVYAYGRGGATESGLVALSQLTPAAVLAPVVGVLAERGAPDRILAYGYWIQSATLGAAAITLALHGPAFAVYGFTMLMTTAVVATRPAQALVVPCFAQNVDGLTALNVVTEWAGQVAIFAAPAAAAGLLALGGTKLVFACFSLALAASALSTPRLPATPNRIRDVGATTVMEIRGGVRTAITEPAVRTVLLVSALTFISIGALDVTTIELAIGRFDGTASTAAWMTATLGAGGIFGAAVGGRLIGRRLAPALVVSALIYGIALGAIGLLPNEAFAFVMLFIAGFGQVVVAISSQSILQRCSAASAVGRIFALREALYCLGLGTGSIVASALIDAFGLEVSLLVIGALLPTCSALNARTMWRLDAAATVPIVELSLLRALPIFQWLPAPTLEGLARSATSIRFEPGAYLLKEGEHGESYLAVAAGVAQVLQHGTVVGTVSGGDGVGEIALLRNVARTASVRAQTTVHAIAVGKEDFFIAVTGHPATAATADTIISGHGVTDTAEHLSPEA